MLASLVLLAFALAADAFAPLLGWALGYWFASLIESFDHWIAFGLLVIVGAKMMWEGARADPPGALSDPGKERVAGGWALLMLAVATSIDAAAAGITLPTLGVPVLVSVGVIAAVTFAMSFAGVWIGRAGARGLGPQAEILGGVVLIVIGAKVLIDHHAFG